MALNALRSGFRDVTPAFSGIDRRRSLTIHEHSFARLSVDVRPSSGGTFFRSVSRKEISITSASESHHIRQRKWIFRVCMRGVRSVRLDIRAGAARDDHSRTV